MMRLRERGVSEQPVNELCRALMNTIGRMREGQPDPAPENSQEGRDREPHTMAELLVAVDGRPRGSTARPTRTAPTLKEWQLADHVEYSVDAYRRLAVGVLGERAGEYPISRAQAVEEHERVRTAQARRREEHEAALQAGEFHQLLFTPEEEREHLLDLVGRLTPRIEAYERPDARQDEAAFVARVMGSLVRLSSREQYVLAMRFGLESGTGYTLLETGAGLGLTRDPMMARERVRQIEAKALRKLRHPSHRDAFVEGGVPDGESPQ